MHLITSQTTSNINTEKGIPTGSTKLKGKAIVDFITPLGKAF